jgi:hypothetical protein
MSWFSSAKRFVKEIICPKPFDVYVDLAHVSNVNQRVVS